MDPVEALDKAIISGYLYDRDIRRKQPGVIIDRMPTEIRDALKELMSDDIKTVRIDDILGSPHARV